MASKPKRLKVIREILMGQGNAKWNPANSTLQKNSNSIFNAIN